MRILVLYVVQSAFLYVPPRKVDLVLPDMRQPGSRQDAESAFIIKTPQSTRTGVDPRELDLLSLASQPLA